MAQQSKHTLGEILCRWHLKIWLKSRYENQCKRCWNWGYFQPKISVAVWGYDQRGKQQEGTVRVTVQGWETPWGRWTRGWAALVSVLLYLELLWHYPLALHRLSLRIQPHETECLRLYRQKIQILLHTGVPMQSLHLTERTSEVAITKKIPAESWKGAAQICQKPLISMR